MAKKQTNRIIDDIAKYRFGVREIMRYETSGDWHDSGKVEVFAGLDKVERLAVGIHELIEMCLCHLMGVTGDMVTAWDTEDTKGAYDPNMYKKDKRYEEAHFAATLIERKIIEAAGRNWEEYDKKIENLQVKWKKPQEEEFHRGYEKGYADARLIHESNIIGEFMAFLKKNDPRSEDFGK